MTHIYSVPTEEPEYEGYKVTVDSQNAPVLQVRCSSMPFNRRWPGHQRSIDQSELCGMVRFWFEEEVKITVTADRDFENAVIRPLSKNVKLHCEGRNISFVITEPGGYSLELDGYHHNLHIFADRKSEYNININDKNVIYYDAGYHEAGIVNLKSNQTVFIDEGAIVYGCFHIKECENVKILGRGIIDNSHNVEELLFTPENLGDGKFAVQNSRREQTIHIVNAKNVYLDGFVIRDSLVYNVGMWNCEDIEIRDLRIVGCWRYNSDGIDFHNCRRGHMSGCFVRTFDDSICYKGHPGYMEVCEDIIAEDCVVWCDWNHALEFGAECCAKQMRNLVYKNIDVIRQMGTALNVGNVDYGHIHDILYENIRVEYDDTPYLIPQIQSNDECEFKIYPDNKWLPPVIRLYIVEHREYSGGRPERGHISDATFRNIQITAKRMPPIELNGFDATHRIDNVVFENVCLNGEKITDKENANITCNEFAEIPLIK